MIKIMKYNDLTMAWELYCYDYANMADYYADQGHLVEYI